MKSKQISFSVVKSLYVIKLNPLLIHFILIIVFVVSFIGDLVIHKCIIVLNMWIFTSYESNLSLKLIQGDLAEIALTY
jgi:hypothetical protein